MPAGALSSTVLAGAPQAVSLGDHVTITGPFASGQTAVQIAFRLPVSSGDVTFEQTLPLAVPSLAVLMKKVGDISLTSPQLPNVQERRVRRGAIHPRAGAGDTGRRAACDNGLGAAAPQPLAAADCADARDRHARRRFLGGAAPAIARRPTPRASKQLNGKREKIFSELVRLEQQRRAGSIDAAKYAERRPALVAQLERVYRDLDAEGGQSAVA